tara:strand:- start:259 stop:450 length:192 start_codon:yes stop_codon:yes gene_type:complete
MTYHYDHLREKQPTGLTAELLKEITSNDEVILHEKRWSHKFAMVEFTYSEDKKRYRVSVEQLD